MRSALERSYCHVLRRVGSFLYEDVLTEKYRSLIKHMLTWISMPHAQQNKYITACLLSYLTSIPPPNSAMHRVLCIEELLEIAAEHLQRTGQDLALVQMACTCKTFTDIALQALWKSVDPKTVFRILRLLPNYFLVSIFFHIHTPI